MSDVPNFTKLVPGFDFLQGLVKNAGAALPSMGQWVAPTLDPAELQKRIDELKTVQFWLEQNAKMLGATIQALEVQRMTLSTLQTMNVQMSDLRDAMKIAPVTAVKPAPPVAAPEPAPEPEPEPAPAPEVAKAKAAPGAVDPMQWWGALTQQFTQLAADAMKDGGTDAARNLAGAMMKPGIDAVDETFRKAGRAPKTTPAAKKAPARKAPAAKRAGAAAGAKRRAG